MFDSLTERLGEVFTRLTKRGALSESDVADALREVRVALLEADVALPVVKDFVKAVQTKAVGTLCPSVQSVWPTPWIWAGAENARTRTGKARSAQSMGVVMPHYT